MSSDRPRCWLWREKGYEIHGRGAVLAQVKTFNGKKHMHVEWPSVGWNVGPSFPTTPTQSCGAGKGLTTVKIKGKTPNFMYSMGPDIVKKCRKSFRWGRGQA